LTREMIAAGARVTGLDIKIERKDTLLTANDCRKIRCIEGSVADYELVKQILLTHKPEVVFHLAAEAIVGKCNIDPVCAFKSNIEGTWNILEAVRKYPQSVKAIVVASSDKAYGSHKKLPYKEDAALKGDHPYDVSKSCADLIVYSYCHTYGVPAAVTRCGNIFGPGDFNMSRIVPDAIRCAIRNDTLKIRSDGMFTRDYVYVKDIVNGYIMLAEQLEKKQLTGEAFNFSDENPVTVLRLMKELRDILKNKPAFTILNEARYEIKHQYLASRKARKVLRWKPKYTLREGLMHTVKWYKEYFNDEGKKDA
ncbi:MAG: GDP-mannose 4,6-dehydratase, partial [Endomicrobiales bacterium]